MHSLSKEDHEANKQPRNEPHDTYHIAYMIHFLLGAGNLLPWNTYITAIDYFHHLYPSHHHIEKVFAITYMTSSLLVLVTMMYCFGAGNGNKLIMSLRLRLNVGFCMFIVSLLVTLLMSGYVMSVTVICVCGFADGLIGGSLLGSAGKLPKQYMQAVFAGTASSGFLVSILRIITKASQPQTSEGLQTSAQIYFILTSIILLFCLASANLLHNLPIMKHHNTNLNSISPISSPNYLKLVKKIKSQAFGVFLIYTVTLSIFPGFLSENLNSALLKDWYPVLLIAIYNASDLIGKCLTSVYILKSVKKAVWGCVMRLVMYPLFVGCLHGPMWLRTEVTVVVLTFILGVTNGYLTSLIMIVTPKTVADSEAEVAALVMAVCLGVGLLSGSSVGWFWII